MQESLLMSPSLEEPIESVEFLGEVPTDGFINGTELASAIGLTRGTAINSNEPWLHFELDGKTLYVAKKPYRHSVNWVQINAQGAVFGARTIELNGETYKVRLLTGVSGKPYDAAGYNPPETATSEWNRLLYTVHNGVHTDTNNTTPPGRWPLYSDTDLVVHSTGGSGYISWCQEASSRWSGYYAVRGWRGITHLGRFNTAGNPSSYTGWRPVLELVP